MNMDMNMSAFASSFVRMASVVALCGVVGGCYSPEPTPTDTLRCAAEGGLVRQNYGQPVYEYRIFCHGVALDMDSLSATAVTNDGGYHLSYFRSVTRGDTTLVWCATGVTVPPDSSNGLSLTVSMADESGELLVTNVPVQPVGSLTAGYLRDFECRTL